jgi:hypothetical protein
MLGFLTPNKKGISCALAISKNQATPSHILARFVQQGAVDAYLEIAKNPNTPLEALRVIAAKDKRDAVAIAISKHPVMLSSGPYELIQTQSIVALKIVAQTMPLSNDEIMTLWKKSGGVRESLLKNPNLSPNVLKKLAEIASEKELIAITSNPSSPPELITSLVGLNNPLIKNAVGMNPSAPYEILDKLASETRGDSAFFVAQNENCPIKILNSLRLHSASHVREAVAKNAASTSEILSFLAKDKDDKVRVAVALNENTSVATLKLLINDRVSSVSSAVAKSSSFGVISSLQGYQPFLKEMGSGAFNFLHLESPKKAMKLLINSKHPSEIEFVFGSETAEAMSALSSLQSGYINHKFKLNRADYLVMLDKINNSTIGRRRTGICVDSVTLKRVMAFFDDDLIVDIISQYEPDEAKDTLRMLGTLVSFVTKRNNRKNQEWVNEQLSLPNYKRPDLHDALTEKTRDMIQGGDIPFRQCSFIDNVKEANKLLDSGWEVNLPTNPIELRNIGDMQSHCVGGQYYAARCIDGSNVIFQIMPKGKPKHGYTFQYSHAGKLLQAKGFSNSSVPSHHVRDSKLVFKTLTQPVWGENDKDEQIAA